MRFVIVGAGGTGGLLGALLARSGSEVAFVARGDQLRALQDRGLRITSPMGSFHTGPLRADAEPGQLGLAEVVLVALKTWQVAEMAPRLKAVVGENTLVLPVQNGVEAAQELASVLGERAVIGCALHVLSRIDEPGAVLHEGPAPRMTIGERHGEGRTPRLHKLAEELRRGGIEVALSTDIDAVLWEKLLFVEPVGAVQAVSRGNTGEIRSTPETRALLVAAMREVSDVARAGKTDIAPDAVEQALARVDKLPGGSTTSMARDITEGRPSELSEQTGAVVRVGRKLSVPTPVHDFLLGALLPQERRARGGR